MQGDDESVEDQPQTVSSLDEAQKTKNPETSQNRDDTSDFQGSIGRDKDAEHRPNDNNCVKYVPAIWKVNSRLNSN